MQTFLPYADYYESAACLDYRRLGNQRNEAFVILENLLGIDTGWQSHPAVKMWRGHELSLCEYGIAMCGEQLDRGYSDSMFDSFYECAKALLAAEFSSETPSWLGLPAFHAAHRAALLMKDPEHYAQFKWREYPVISYVWPT